MLSIFNSIEVFILSIGQAYHIDLRFSQILNMFIIIYDSSVFILFACSVFKYVLTNRFAIEKCFSLAAAVYIPCTP